MAEVVRQGQALGQLLVQTERARHAAADLRSLESVGQARTVVVALVDDEDLGLVLETAERGTVDHAVAVTLIAGAQGVLGLGILPPTAVGAAHAPRREVLTLPRLLRQAIDQAARAHGRILHRHVGRAAAFQ
jgi:hypothetical protein